jgi:peptide deformylase
MSVFMKRFEKILQYNDPKLGRVLREKAKDIKEVDNEIKSLFEDLKTLASKNSKDGIVLVGLSAPQVGYSVSAFVFFDLKQEKYIEVINPRLIYTSKETTVEWEGCASIGTGKKSLFGPVKRPRMSQIQYTNLAGEEKVLSVSNFQSHILLHEMDHLDGILFLDKVEDPMLILTASELDEYARKNNGDYPKL